MKVLTVEGMESRSPLGSWVVGVVSKSIEPYINNTGSVGEYGGNGNKVGVNECGCGGS